MVETLQSLDADLVVEGEGSDLDLGEDKAREATEKDRFSIACLDSESSGGIGRMVTSETGGEDRVEGAVMCSDTGKDSCEVVGAASTSDAEVVSLEGGEDNLATHNEG